MQKTVRMELDEFLKIIKACFGDSLDRVLLYGSYARGDYNDRSDVDVMILVTLDDAQIKQMENEIYDSAFELELKYGKVLSPVIKNREFFEEWSETLPFYRNIKNEGVKVA